MTIIEFEETMTVEELIRTSTPRDICVILINPDTDDPLEVGQTIRSTLETIERSQWTTIAFQFLRHKLPPWERQECVDWSKAFVDQYVDVMTSMVDEMKMASVGWRMPEFPGVGILRLIAIAGYGTFSKTPCGEYWVEPNETGRAILTAIRGGGTPC